MENNPYAPPKTNVDPARRGASADSSIRLYTPDQHFVASFIGSPIAAAWFAAANYRVLGRQRAARDILVWGAIATVVILALSYALPEGFPNVVVPLAYSLGVRQLAQQRFGHVVSEHRAAGGQIGSWWRVIGISFLLVFVLFLIVFGVVLLFGGVEWLSF